MCKILFFLFISSILITKAQTVYPSLNINLLATLNPETDNTNPYGDKYSGCWGWHQASKNKEYAIIGSSAHTYFIDVTNPTAPIIADVVNGKRTGCIWKEIKTYQNYCYVVSDDAAPNSFQIIDMQYLPDSVHVVYDGKTYFERSHTIFIDNDKLYCGSVTAASGGGFSSMRVYSLATPSVPVLLAKLEQHINTSTINSVHDMFVRNDTIYASCGYDGFHILKFNSSNNSITLLQSFTAYSFSGYNHSSWQTDDRKTMVMTDEVPEGLPAKVLDVSDFNNINSIKTITPHPQATPHNPYIIGNKWCWLSSYIDGVYLYDISNPTNTSLYGYFDTHPQAESTDVTIADAYEGNWGAYPYLPSKIIIATDQKNGIFILDGNNYYKGSVATNVTSNSKASNFNVYPNPANNELNFIIANEQQTSLTIKINNLLGNELLSQTLTINNQLFKTSINTTDLANGCYIVTLVGDNYHETKKIIIQK